MIYLFIEKYIENPRHIEVQILADKNALNTEEVLEFEDTDDIVQDLEKLYYKAVGGLECDRQVNTDGSEKYACGVSMNKDIEFDQEAIFNAMNVEARTIIMYAEDRNEVHDQMKSVGGLRCIQLNSETNTTYDCALLTY